MKIKWFLLRLYNRYFSGHKHFVKQLSDLLGFIPVHIHIYQLVFQHKSKHRENNERLEFLGDAIFSAAVSNELYRYFPKASEGELSQLRARVVSRKTLNRIGNAFGLIDMLDFKLSANHEDTNLAGNTMEALIGAIYIDQGYKRAATFIIEKIIRQHIDWEEIQKRKLDYKSLLFHYAQTEEISLSFSTIEENIQPGKTEYIMAAIWNEQEIARGKGKNKKTAEQEAAKKALQALKLSDTF